LAGLNLGLLAIVCIYPPVDGGYVHTVMGDGAGGGGMHHLPMGGRVAGHRGQRKCAKARIGNFLRAYYRNCRC
jgi:hypothetical protein